MIKAPFSWRREPDLSYRILDANNTVVAQIDAGMSAVHQEAAARAVTNALNTHSAIALTSSSPASPLALQCPSCHKTESVVECTAPHTDGVEYMLCKSCHFHWLKPSFMAVAP